MKKKVLLKELERIVEVQNPYRPINCTVTIGKSKEEVLITFPVNRFIDIEGGYLYLKDDDRRLKLYPGQIGVIERQLSGESKI